MDREFFLETQHPLEEAPFSTLIIVIDGRPIPFGDMVEELEEVHVLLRDFSCMINSNIIHCPKYSVIVGLP